MNFRLKTPLFLKQIYARFFSQPENHLNGLKDHLRHVSKREAENQLGKLAGQLDKSQQSDEKTRDQRLTVEYGQFKDLYHKWDDHFNQAVDVVFEEKVAGYERANKVERDQVVILVKNDFDDACYPFGVHLTPLLQGDGARYMRNAGFATKEFKPIVTLRMID